MPFYWEGRYILFFLYKYCIYAVETQDFVHYGKCRLVLQNGSPDEQDWHAATGKMCIRDRTGVTVEVNFTSDVVGTHLAGKYAAGDPYTIMLVDHPDVYDFQEYLADLSGEDWIKDGGDTYGITIDGKVYSFPFTVEAVGLIYNADAIEKIKMCIRDRLFPAARSHSHGNIPRIQIHSLLQTRPR